jgi:hypothetical protein
MNEAENLKKVSEPDIRNFDKFLDENEIWQEWERLSKEMPDGDPRLYMDGLDDHTRKVKEAKSRIRMRGILENAFSSIQSICKWAG